MRAIIGIAVLAASCGRSGEGSSLAGGSLTIPECGYSVTTDPGAEPPMPSDQRLGADPTPRLVHLGIAGDPRSSVVIEWRTADEATTAGVVRLLGDGAQPTETRRGIHFGVGRDGHLQRHHQVHLCDLQPGTRYRYQVGSVGPDGRESFSPVRAFRTAPDPAVQPDAELVVGVVADIRGRFDVWTQLVAQLGQRVPDVLVASHDARSDEALAIGEPLFATAPLVDASHAGLDYGFAHVASRGDRSIVVRGDRAPGSVATVELARLEQGDAAAVVRVRRDVISVDTFGPDGITLSSR